MGVWLGWGMGGMGTIRSVDKGCSGEREGMKGRVMALKEAHMQSDQVERPSGVYWDLGLGCGMNTMYNVELTVIAKAHWNLS